MSAGRHDRRGRPLGTLRLSLTDRCNLRCLYCMPEDAYVWLPDASVLLRGELVRLARVFASLGVREVRLTGGEPLLRQDLVEIVDELARVDGVGDLALTTNGVLLAEKAGALRAAGLTRVTVSLDTLQPERARGLSRTTRLDDVFAGLDAVRAAGFERTRINTVVIRGRNDDELPALVRFAASVGAEVRFIEYMDVGGATRWRMEDVVSRAEILARLGDPEPLGRESAGAPASRFRMSDGAVVGVIASTTEPFCASCDRARVTADGLLLGCLYAEAGVDLRAPMRAGATDVELATIVGEAWSAREDHGAELRRAAAPRDALVPLGRLRKDPHREMHTRGG